MAMTSLGLGLPCLVLPLAEPDMLASVLASR